MDSSLSGMCVHCTEVGSLVGELPVRLAVRLAIFIWRSIDISTLKSTGLTAGLKPVWSDHFRLEEKHGYSGVFSRTFRTECTPVAIFN